MGTSTLDEIYGRVCGISQPSQCLAKPMEPLLGVKNLPHVQYQLDFDISRKATCATTISGYFGNWKATVVDVLWRHLRNRNELFNIRRQGIVVNCALSNS